jgi:hypothetical protein
MGKRNLQYMYEDECPLCENPKIKFDEVFDDWAWDATAREILEELKIESGESVTDFLDRNYFKDCSNSIPLQLLYDQYRRYCLITYYTPLGIKGFKKSLVTLGVNIYKKRVRDVASLTVKTESVFFVPAQT